MSTFNTGNAKEVIALWLPSPLDMRVGATSGLHQEKGLCDLGHILRASKNHTVSSDSVQCGVRLLQNLYYIPGYIENLENSESSNNNIPRVLYVLHEPALVQ